MLVVSGNYAMVALLGHVFLAEHIMAAEKQMIHKETHVAFEDSVSVSFLHFCSCLHLLMLVIATFAAAKVQLFFELCKHMIKKCTYCIKKVRNRLQIADFGGIVVYADGVDATGLG